MARLNEVASANVSRIDLKSEVDRWERIAQDKRSKVEPTSSEFVALSERIAVYEELQRYLTSQLGCAAGAAGKEPSGTAGPVTDDPLGSRPQSRNKKGLNNE